MYAALLARDPSFEGIFIVGVRTTGIFCRVSCRARKPNRNNVEFFRGTADAVAAGYRPCRRCRPLETAGQPPVWLAGLLAAVEAEPQRRWSDRDLVARQLSPSRVRRWFKEQHGMTFQAYSRMRRLGTAWEQLRAGNPAVQVAGNSGYESLSGFGEALKQLLGAPPLAAAAGNPPVYLTRILSPLGPLLAGANEAGLCLLEFADRRMLPLQIRRMTRALACRLMWGEQPWLAATRQQLAEYFRGERQTFDLPLVAPGTPFQELIWARLQEIPYGTTLSYDQLARAVGRPGARRAVGRANGDNRLAIVIPCHRVVRSDGTWGGYGGGKWRKEALLGLERDGILPAELPAR